MTPLATAERPRMNERDQRERRTVKKRYPAPPCPKCDSDNTMVYSSPELFQRCKCLEKECGHTWKVRR